ncbi:MAG: hypothetical protein LBT25_02565 [Candidatus Symbiothrix sp.]|jgi:hypothetical protein|nr:hypothetical protein [Candidatus Symbiothrix sp.]
MKSQLKKNYWLLAFVAICPFLVTTLKAQVTIGSSAAPDAQAVLDLRSGYENGGTGPAKGLLLPRVSITDVASAAPFVTAPPAGTMVYNIGGGGTGPAPGLYYWNDKANWEPAYTAWFYMPPTNIDTEKDGIDKTLDLYTEYEKQLGGASPLKRNPGAPGLFLEHFERSDFHYYITGYSNTVFEIIDVSDTGILKYKIIGDADDSTYINIVFVRKHR